MWAKNSTPSPGFLEESLGQDMIQGTMDQGDNHSVLGLELRPPGPSSRPSGLALDIE